MDVTAHTKLIGEKAAELNKLIQELPVNCRAEVDILDIRCMQNQFEVPHISVSVFQWLGGNRRAI